MHEAHAKAAEIGGREWQRDLFAVEQQPPAGIGGVVAGKYLDQG